MYKPSRVPLDLSQLPRYTENELESIAGELNGYPVKRYVPVWAGSTAPSLGNGSLYAWYYLNRDLCSIWFKLVAGSTTTFGTGGWTFQSPVLAGPIPAIGILHAFDTSGSARYAGQCRIVDGENTIRVEIGSPLAVVTGVAPFTWATGDELFGHIEFIRRADS